MRYKELFESVDTSYYMEEGCGIFAVALAELYPNGEIYIFSNNDGEEWDDNISFEITHVFYKLNNDLYDVTGKTNINKIKDEFHVVNYSIKGPYDKTDFENKFMGETDDKPLYGSKNDVEEAIRFIKDNNYKI